jgi:hypothetical protein
MGVKDRHAEKIIGSIRRECLQVIILIETHLRRVWSRCFRAFVTKQEVPGPPPHPTASSSQDCRISRGRRAASSPNRDRFLVFRNPTETKFPFGAQLWRLRRLYFAE